MIERILRAIKMDKTLYLEVGKNPSFMNEATIIAIVVGVVAALGNLFVPYMGFVNFLLGLIISVGFGWVLWSLVVQWVGKLQGGTATFQEMLRAMAYSGIPRILGLLGFIPVIGWLIAFAAGLYSAWLSVIAIRELEGFDTQKAIITALAGWAVFFVGSLVVGGIYSSIAAASVLSIFR